MELSPHFIWRSDVYNAELKVLHAECFDHTPTNDDWNRRLRRHSLGWVCARHKGVLIGFVNVVSDGGKHAFVIDLMVKKEYRRQRIGLGLMQEVVECTRHLGHEWLHVDFEESLRAFYIGAVGFRGSAAGVMRLN